MARGTTQASWTGIAPAACYDSKGRHPHPADVTLWTAHKTLPCGTRIQVCLADDPARCVTVSIRDRGPYVHGRDLDLSRAAFNRLADPAKGVITVTWEVIA